MGNTREFGNMSNIENNLHEPATTNRKTITNPIKV